jgi:hypothetical protein
MLLVMNMVDSWQFGLGLLISVLIGLFLVGWLAARRRTLAAGMLPPRTTKGVVAFRFLSVIIGLTGGLLLAEAVLWIAGIEPPRLRGKQTLVRRSETGNYYHCYASNPNQEFQPVPVEAEEESWELLDNQLRKNQVPIEWLEKTPWCVEYEVSSQQIRDREYQVPLPTGVTRIAMVGDSFVYGEGVPFEAILPKRVESLLGEGFEVVNGGRSGIGTHAEVQMLRGPVQRFGCSRAIVVFIANDVELTGRLKQRQKFINDLINVREEYLTAHESRIWYTGHLRTLHFLGAFLEMRRIRQETIQWYLDSYDWRYNAENLNQLNADFRAMTAIPGCQVVLVLYPLIEGLEKGYPLAAVHQRVSSLAGEANLPVLDLAEVFQGMDTQSLQVHPCDHHPNGKAHDIAGRAIVQWLRDEVPGFLAR